MESANSSPNEISRWLELWRSGHAEALDSLLPLVYKELRALAAHQLGRERSDHTLQPTALVHEAYFRLLGKTRARIKDKAHFFAVAAQAMRRILVDHARRLGAEKRIGPGNKVSLDNKLPLDVASPSISTSEDLLALNLALERLQDIDAAQARVVELRYFGGLTTGETAEVMQLSTATVERYWRVARLWLRHQLSHDS